MTNRTEQKIAQGGLALGLPLTQLQCEKLAGYISLLAKWNKIYSLISTGDEDHIINRHLLDSLAIVPHIIEDDGSLLDVGSGAGLPGVPVAITKSSLPVTLIDSNGKKTRFLQQVKAELNLTNITVINARIENAKLPQFTTVTTRAFATISDTLILSGKHCEDDGCLLLMKGMISQHELADVNGKYTVKDLVALKVPYCKNQRHIVRIVKNKDYH